MVISTIGAVGLFLFLKKGGDFDFLHVGTERERVLWRESYIRATENTYHDTLVKTIAL